MSAPCGGRRVEGCQEFGCLDSGGAGAGTRGAGTVRVGAGPEGEASFQEGSRIRHP